MKRGQQDLQRLEQRIARLERRLPAAARASKARSSPAEAIEVHPMVPVGLGMVVLFCGYLGLGVPQHYYQPLFACLVLALAYHRRFWLLPVHPWRWPQVVVNFLMLSLFFKLLIGGGTRYPLDWLRVPALRKVPPSEGSPWYEQVFPNFDVQWEGIPALTDLSIDITMIQTMLLIATLAGALFRFQPFASLTAVLLLVVSIPTFLGFNWDWVVLFLVLGGISLYLQTSIVSAAMNSRPEKRH
ncbi:MAG: hypothetical protein ACE5LB_07220 [Acidiferrobacterales bacterium]